MRGTRSYHKYHTPSSPGGGPLFGVLLNDMFSGPLNEEQDDDDDDAFEWLDSFEEAEEFSD